MHYDEKISGARIRTHDLWIRKRVCYPLHHSASRPCVTAEVHTDLRQRLQPARRSLCSWPKLAGNSFSWIGELRVDGRRWLDDERLNNAHVAKYYDDILWMLILFNYFVARGCLILG